KIALLSESVVRFCLNGAFLCTFVFLSEHSSHSSITSAKFGVSYFLTAVYSYECKNGYPLVLIP
ncbi:unnamed protein product, partial [Sphagnum tenellum]